MSASGKLGNFWAKLKREWKTAVAAVASTAVGIWEAGAQYFDFTPIVPEKYRPFTPLVLGLTFLLLRKWLDNVPAKSDPDSR